MDILKTLLLFLRPGVGDDPPADPGENDQFAEADDEPPASDALPADDEPPARNAAQEEAERRAAAERERTERLERENIELRARIAPPRDIAEEDENRRLADPNTPALEKWQIQANRELKAGRSTAQAALLQAQDVNDRTAFASIAMTDPTAKKYETRVEKELADMRARGQNAPREAIYTFLLGKDMREGKFKKKDAPKPGEHSAVNRGKLPGARSDVGARGQLTNHEKLAKKLENVQI